MSSSARRWSRLGYPPTWHLALAVVTLLTFDLLLLAICWSVGWQQDATDRRWMVPFLTMPMMGAVMLGVYLGYYRMSRFPREDSSYGNWLLRTPWQGKLPTPFGPWRPIAWDVVVLGGLSLFGLLHAVGQSWCAGDGLGMFNQWLAMGAGIAGPWLGFALAWVARGDAIVWGQWKWDWWFAGLAIGLGINCVAHDVPQFLIVLIPLCLIALLITVWRRLERMLRDLPETTLGSSQAGGMSRHIGKGSYDAQRPYFEAEFDLRRTSVAHWLPTNWRVAVATSSLVFVVCLSFTPLFVLSDAYRTASLSAVLLSMMTGLVGGLIWCSGTRSHLSLAARWATKRFLVWEYDRARLVPLLAPPLVTAVIVWIGPYVMWQWLCIPAAISASVFTVLVVGPDRKQWWFTAPMTYVVATAGRRTVPGRSKTSRTLRSGEV